MQQANFSRIPLSEFATQQSPHLVKDGEHEDFSIPEGVVSFQSEVPVDLQSAMTAFIERYPNWDQYRLIQAALAGFLVQNGVVSRSITRLYIGKMFSTDSLE